MLTITPPTQVRGGALASYDVRVRQKGGREFWCSLAHSFVLKVDFESDYSRPTILGHAALFEPSIDRGRE